TGDRDDVDDVGGRCCNEPGQQRAEAPDASQVVDAHHVLDHNRVAVEEAGARGDAGVVDEQAGARVTLEDPRAHRLDRLTVADVAYLDLSAYLAGKRAQPVLATRDEHAQPAFAGEAARNLGSDARRRSGDDGDLVHLHIRIARWLKTSLEDVRSCSVSRTSARSRGRSRKSSRPAGRSSPSPTRASASSRASAISPQASTRRSSRSATFDPTRTSPGCSARSARHSAASSTISSTRSPSRPRRISRAASPTRRATASGSQST